MFVCIRPSNFPLAIFLGQVAAAPRGRQRGGGRAAPPDAARRRRAVGLHARGGRSRQAPSQLVPGGGGVGATLVGGNRRVAGVAFTGSTAVARRIKPALAAKDARIVPLIAETGGVDAMIVDATACRSRCSTTWSPQRSEQPANTAPRCGFLCVHEEVGATGRSS